MIESDKFLVFTLDEQRYALRLSTVERVIRMVEVIPLPKTPDIVTGVINLQGRVIPVFNVRKRFGLKEHEPDPDDHLIIARTSRRTVGLVVDEVSGLVESAVGEMVRSETILPGLKYVDGVVKLQDGMILIHDLDLFLSIDEEKVLEEALDTPIKVAQ